RFGILRLAVCASGRGVGRRLRRFCERRLGARPRPVPDARWPGPLPPFARHLYQALTQYLGFPSYGDEYKVMGLAAYGTPGPAIEQVRRLVRLQPDGSFALDLRFFRHQREDIGYEWEGGSPDCQPLFSSELEHALGPRRAPNDPLTSRHHDLAFATQAV